MFWLQARGAHYLMNAQPIADSQPRGSKLPSHLVEGREDANLVDLNSYISGYVDGEGCFCVSFQPSERHRFRWEVRPSFSVSQNLDRSEVLYLIQNAWKCGFIRPDRSDKTLKYEVRSIEALTTTVVPHFRRFPLISAKQADFEKFAEVCEAVDAGKHLAPAGFEQIVRLAFEMNPSGKRKYLPGQILSSLTLHRRIVCA